MTHGADPGHEHSHGGSAHGLGWDLLDSIVLASGVAVAILLAEMMIKARRDRVRYDLTPAAESALRAEVAEQRTWVEQENAALADWVRERTSPPDKAPE